MFYQKGDNMLSTIADYRLYDDDKSLVFEIDDEVTIKLNDVIFNKVTITDIRAEYIDITDSQCNEWSINIDDIVSIER